MKEEVSIQRKRLPMLVLKLLQKVAELHEKGIIHADLKPENIVLIETEKDVDVKFIDFDVAIAPGEPSKRCRRGTPKYEAPEGKKTQEYTIQSDIWSLGIVIYELYNYRELYPTKDGKAKMAGHLQSSSRPIH